MPDAEDLLESLLARLTQVSPIVDQALVILEVSWR
ncbi:MAG: hypothetical protein JW395_1123 [Nitrospira sp.]|nr:hypothetical protein [Nitrospira sp.]